MYPVLKITLMLNFLDTSTMGVTFGSEQVNSDHDMGH
jgi:hypothetical protein